MAGDELLKHRRAVAFLLITAVREELLAFISELTPLEGQESILHGYIDKEAYYVGRLGHYPVALTRSEPGSTGRGAAALCVSSGIRNWQPRAVILAGIAFGARPDKQELGDVIVAESVITYERERVGYNIVSRAVIVESGQVLLSRFKDLGPRMVESEVFGFSIHFGPILSGEKLIAQKQFRDELLAKYPSAIGGDMEAAGLYSATSREGPEWIVVKGICDWATSEKDDQAHSVAARNAARVVAEVLRNPHAFEGLAAIQDPPPSAGSIADIQVKIKRDFDSMTSEDYESFIVILKATCGLTGSVLVMDKQPGCVRITLRLSIVDVARVRAAMRSGALSELGVIEVLAPQEDSLDDPASRAGPSTHAHTSDLPAPPPDDPGTRQPSTSPELNDREVGRAEDGPAESDGQRDGGGFSSSPPRRPKAPRVDRESGRSPATDSAGQGRVKHRELISERVYDLLLNAQTADKVLLYFKDGRIVRGALIFNAFKGTGRLIDIEQETQIEFSVDDIRDCKLQ